MDAAFLYGKTGEEDQLTSDIFGLIRYLPPDLVLWPFLKRAECFVKNDLVQLDKQIGFPPVRAKYFFWPSAHVMAKSEVDRALDRQPDLLILLSDSAGHFAALVTEIKYRGFKHNIDPRGQEETEDRAVAISTGDKAEPDPLDLSESNGDQLADYLRALQRDAISLRSGGARSSRMVASVEEEDARQQERLSAVPGDKRFLLYLTDDASPPMKEIEDTRKSFSSSSWPKAAGHLFWLGWTSLYEVVEQRLAGLSESENNLQLILRDILRLLDARDLHAFGGWRGAFSELPIPTPSYFWNPQWFSNLDSLDVRLTGGVRFWKNAGDLER
jgi:hypothetical protein